ncbi:MAG: restriction endonuclease [Alphaproteobacteria bacterium]|nr:restriction endonuclease [Alphaproteobacteria bacterium]MDA8008722.1 restriction endonuclease [Alphaproteobacteria bacterium]
MSRYNFKSLSPQDFEELIRDLLQAEEGVPVEAFKAGRDGGIDLRYKQANGDEVIVQCKHYVDSDYSKLVSNLRKNELPKVQKLSPKRYIVATSLELTVGNKDRIVEVMHPFIKSTDDILGAKDIEGLLSIHESIEKKNFKLWLTNTAMVEYIFNRAEQCQTDFRIEEIQRKLPLFVQNRAFPRALEILNETRVLVISGMPGIGKTTLAEMLLYEHLPNDYQPVVIQENVTEGRKFFSPEDKQVFYYDDFLGRVFLEDRKGLPGLNKDADLLSFANMISRSKHGRFILTTREHTLTSALRVSEKLSHSFLLQDRCIIELSDYSRAQKARILYNHLYFSDLPQPYKDAVLENRFFLRIIKHEQFNPRLIEWLSAYRRVSRVPPSEYQEHILNLLDSPESIWLHAFQNEISTSAQRVLLTLYTTGGRAETSVLESAFRALRSHCASKYNERTTANEFYGALRDLDGGFLMYRWGHVNFLNPSVREFIASIIIDNRDTAEDLLRSSISFNQVIALWKLAQFHEQSVIAQFLENNQDALCEVLNLLLPDSQLRQKSTPGSLQDEYVIDRNILNIVGFAFEIATAYQSEPFIQTAVRAANLEAKNKYYDPSALTGAVNLLVKMSRNDWFLENGGKDAYMTLFNFVKSHITFATAGAWLAIIESLDKLPYQTETDREHFGDALSEYCETDAMYEVENCQDFDERMELRSDLEELMKKHDLDFAEHIRDLDEAMTEYGDGEEDHDEWRFYGGEANQGEISDDEISQMFDTLRDDKTS